MKKLFVVLLIVIGMALPTPARADVAPPQQPPGSNLEPGEETTQVRMMVETVLIDIRPGSGDSLGIAQVTADFTMRNLGNETETMAARFPISANDGRFVVREIRNLQVQVDGRTVSTRRIQGEDPYWESDLVPWAEFEARFPPGKDVAIRVSYTLDGTGYYPFTSFYYILSTGAGWKDTIGQADLILRLPYEANEMNVILGTQIGWAETTPGAQLEGKEVRWRYQDLEPGPEHNLEVALVAPTKWQRVLREQENTAKNPNDGEAWGRLAKLYKEIAFLPKELRPDPGGQMLYDLSVEAYERCLELKPNDADWHAGYAELLWWHYNTTQWSNPTDDRDLKRSLDLLARAFEINPKSAKTRELLSVMAGNYPEYVQEVGEGYVFLYLTATPAIQPSATPVPPSPTPTPEPSLTPTLEPSLSPRPSEAPASSPTPVPTSKPSEGSPPPTAEPTPTTGGTGIQICGVGLFAPAALAVIVGVKRRKKGRWV